MIIFSTFIHVQAFVHFRSQFHSWWAFATIVNSRGCNMNSCVRSYDDFIFWQRIALMRTLIILLITSIDSFTCPKIRFFRVFQTFQYFKPTCIIQINVYYCRNTDLDCSLHCKNIEPSLLLNRKYIFDHSLLDLSNKDFVCDI